ncbi:MAG: ribosome biogenesis GTPase YlqF [Saccharofermentans sp.]|nr:ribosome biogenesis GTPase YlqF [Saccharofermentans sp.]
MSETKNNSSNINWFPGHMRKALNETRERLKLVDIVYETCDCRIPFSSRNPELDKLIGDKPRIVILNKADLADPAKTSMWLKHFESIKVNAIAIEASHKKGLDKLYQMTEELLKDKLESAAARGRVGRPMRAIVVGCPNTGKSTLINGLAGKKVVVTGDRPGVTRDFKWVQTPGRLELMDMAGVLWPRIATRRSSLCLAMCGSVKDEIADITQTAYDSMKILTELYPKLMEDRYGVKIPDASDIDPDGFGYQDPYYDMFLEMGKHRGCVMSGGRIDEDRFSRLLLNDFREGRIGRITLEVP